MIHKLDSDGSCAKLGDSAEKLFKEIALAKGWKIRDAVKKEQFQHLDFWIKKNDNEKELAIEVKGKKRISRSDLETNDLMIWVELLNVQGNPGWAYGKADKIAFRNTDVSFIIVDRIELVKFVEANLEHKYVKNPEEAYKKLYKRWNRSDMLTLISVKDLLSIPTHEILCF